MLTTRSPTTTKKYHIQIFDNHIHAQSGGLSGTYMLFISVIEIINAHFLAAAILAYPLTLRHHGPDVFWIKLIAFGEAVHGSSQLYLSVMGALSVMGVCTLVPLSC